MIVMVRPVVRSGTYTERMTQAFAPFVVAGYVVGSGSGITAVLGVALYGHGYAPVGVLSGGLLTMAAVAAVLVQQARFKADGLSFTLEPACINVFGPAMVTNFLMMFGAAPLGFLWLSWSLIRLTVNVALDSRLAQVGRIDERDQRERLIARYRILVNLAARAMASDTCRRRWFDSVAEAMHDFPEDSQPELLRGHLLNAPSWIATSWHIRVRRPPAHADEGDELQDGAKWQGK